MQKNSGTITVWSASGSSQASITLPSP